MKDDLEFNTKFIALIEERPCLYDYNRSDYSYRYSNDTAWLEIAKILNESVADCKDRWKNLRGCYTRHLKKNSRQSGSSTKHVQAYYLADNLQFLKKYTKSRPPKGIYKIEQNTSKIDDDTEDSREFETSPPAPSATGKRVTCNRDDEQFEKSSQIIKKRKKVSLTHVNATARDYIQSSQNIANYNESQDPDHAFLYSILPEVKDMTREQKRIFKMGVLQLISDIFEENIPASPAGQNYDSSFSSRLTPGNSIPSLPPTLNSQSDRTSPNLNTDSFGLSSNGPAPEPPADMESIPSGAEERPRTYK